MRYYLGWALIGLVVAFTVFSVSYFPNLRGMQLSTVYLELHQDCTVENYLARPGQRECQEVLGHASGVLLENGYILTAAHVADSLEYENVTIVVGFRHGEQTTAELVSYKYDFKDKEIKSDIALLRIEEDFGYPAATINCSTQPVGTTLFIVGHPSYTLWTTTRGYVMGNIPREGQMPGSWLAIDGTIWKGNSGGPVFNYWGQIVGIVSHGIVVGFGSPVGLNYAVSGPIICKFLEDQHGNSWCTASNRYSGLRGESALEGSANGIS